ncbi:TPA: hypothetical protein QDB07_000779 [Burkholderia vietnamiensis]|nr:hypothetical protein [Burkholderia vietnamiensis]
MARYNLSLVFEQPSAEQRQAVDLNGWTLDDWFDNGFLGWDAKTYTYFLQLEAVVADPHDPEEGVDVLAWSFGKTMGEVMSPFEARAILGAVFGVNPDTFVFKHNVLRQLLEDRDVMFRTDRITVKGENGDPDHIQDVVTVLHANDGAYLRGLKRPHDDWIAVHAKGGVKATERMTEVIE